MNKEFWTNKIKSKIKNRIHTSPNSSFLIHNSAKFPANRKFGFTLVETLVAITVLLLAVTGPLTIAARSLNSANFSQDQITAFYLAQEGVEAIRNIRDKNAIAGQPWLSGLENCQSGSSCVIDSTDNSVSLCSGSCSKIKYNSSSGLYGYNASWSDSKFIRTIQISETSSVEAMLTVIISWQSGNINRQFTVNENVLNWQQGQ